MSRVVKRCVRMRSVDGSLPCVMRRYCFYWMFYQDGTVEYEIKLTGELSTNAFAPGEDAQNPGYGTLVDPGINAQARWRCGSPPCTCKPWLEPLVCVSAGAVLCDGLAAMPCMHGCGGKLCPGRTLLRDG